MKILLTGAKGYIGLRLLPHLLEQDHHVVCAVRNKNRFSSGKELLEKIEIVELDFMKDTSSPESIKDIDIAFYLIHSMTASTKDFDEKEALAAHNLNKLLAQTSIKQVIFLKWNF